MPDPGDGAPRVAGLVLAAGRATRFGSAKLAATLDGRPLLDHVLGAVAEAGLAPIVVVVGEHETELEAAVDWRDARRVHNPNPGAGLSSSVSLGIAAVEAERPRVDACVILLGDQPRVRPATIRALLDAWSRQRSPAVGPRYRAGGGANPVLLDRSSFSLANEADGDRGIGPILEGLPGFVRVDVDGENPDVDTPADLERLQALSRRERAPADEAIAGAIEVLAPRTAVWAFATDPLQVGWCAPGIESIEADAPDRFHAVASVGIGSIGARFEIEVVVRSFEAPDRATIAATGRAPAGEVTALGELVLAGPPDGPTTLHWQATIDLDGPAAGVPRSLVDAAARKLATDAFACAKQRLESGAIAG